MSTATTTSGGGFKTFGDWWVLGSTLAEVTAGGGKVSGDSRTCTPDAGASGCVTDTFRGFSS